MNQLTCRSRFSQYRRRSSRLRGLKAPEIGSGPSWNSTDLGTLNPDKELRGDISNSSAVGLATLFENDNCVHRFSPDIARDTNHRDFLHGGM